MPLEDLDVIDIILAPDERGQIGLIITDSGVTSDPEERYRLFMTKSKRYLREVYSAEWLAQYPGKKPSDFFIKFVCTEAPTDEMKRVTVVRSPRTSKEQLRVVFEVWRPEGADASTKASDEPELPQIVSEDALNAAAGFAREMFPESVHPDLATIVLTTFAFATRVAKVANFVMAVPWTDAKTHGKPIVVFFEAKDKQHAEKEVVCRAHCVADEEETPFQYWSVLYTASATGENGEEELVLAAEGWKRDERKIVGIGQVFQRGGLFRRFRLIGGPHVFQMNPEDVFGIESKSALNESAVAAGIAIFQSEELQEIYRLTLRLAQQVLPVGLMVPTCYTTDHNGKGTICAFPFEAHANPMEAMQGFLRQEIAAGRLRSYGIAMEATYHSQSRNKDFDALLCLLEHQNGEAVKLYQLFTREGDKISFGELIHKPMEEPLFGIAG